MAKILVADDDKELAEIICGWLIRDNHTAEHVADGNEAFARISFYDYDLIVLDWGLPGRDGAAILTAMRSRGLATPVLMLTGKNTLEDKVEGLTRGADDYLTKPFNGRELMARINALLRRPMVFVSVVLKEADLELDTRSCVASRAGKELRLVPTEYALLEFLMRHPRQYFSAKRLLELVWANDSEATTEALTTCIKRLRRKIDLEGQESIIKNKHGLGYGLFADDSAASS